MKIIAVNKDSRFNYQVLKTYECGIELKGSEVKSIRNGGLNIKNSYVSFKDNQAFVIGVHIGKYDQANNFIHHDPDRTKKLLLHKMEIKKIIDKKNSDMLQCVVTKAYYKQGLIKFEIALAKSKNKADKRETIKKREHDRYVKKLVW